MSRKSRRCLCRCVVYAVGYAGVSAGVRRRPVFFGALFRIEAAAVAGVLVAWASAMPSRYDGDKQEQPRAAAYSAAARTVMNGTTGSTKNGSTPKGYTRIKAADILKIVTKMAN